MKIFIFTPFQWSYCGGAIGAVAENYDEAVSILRAYKEKDPLYGVECPSGYISEHEYIYPYGKALFIKPGEEDKAEVDETNQWILTYSAEVNDSHGPRIVLDNWNFA